MMRWITLGFAVIFALGGCTTLSLAFDLPIEDSAGYVQTLGVPNWRFQAVDEWGYRSPQLLNRDPIWTQTQDLVPGLFLMDATTRNAVGAIFGEETEAWFSRHIRVGLPVDFSESFKRDAAAFYEPDTRWVVLRPGKAARSAWVFQVVVHEITHDWEHQHYKHVHDIDFGDHIDSRWYDLPPVGRWSDLNIEQEAEVVATLAVLAYLLHDDREEFWNRTQWFRRSEGRVLIDYMIREMYFN